jgi:hypothetical protein
MVGRSGWDTIRWGPCSHALRRRRYDRPGMVAYKVLVRGRSCFTGWSWPLPDGERPGEWVEANGQLELCVNGVHASSATQLPQWLGEDLWRIELDGEILETRAALVARRGRLLGRVAEWDLGARQAFGQACADRALRLTEASSEVDHLLEAVPRFARLGKAGPAGYWAAVLAGYRESGEWAGGGYDDAFTRERSLQGSWLALELGLGA